MIFSSYRICVILLFLVNFQAFPVVIGKETLLDKEIINCDENLQNATNFKDLIRNYYDTMKKELNSKSANNEEIENEKSPWFLNVPLLPVVVATSKSIPEGSCKKQLMLYLNHLKNGTLWATQMFDSSTKYPYGIIDGFTRHLGSYDQCTRIQTTINNGNGKIDEIRSRYCLVDIKFKETNEPTFTGEHGLFFDPQASSWEAIREKGDFRRYQRYLLQVALCFPAVCQTEDIVTTLKEPLDKFGKNFVFLLIFTIVVISTVVDLNSNEKNKTRSLTNELLSCFSARKNLNEICQINSEHQALDSIHFIRVAIVSITIAAHRIFQYIYVGSINGQFIEWIATKPIFGFFHNVTILIDGFLAIGALLLSHSILEKLNVTRNLNYVRLISNRLIRILPLYMFVTFFYATIFYRLGSGPNWEITVGFNKNSCSSYWWTNLFLINNYVGGVNKCILQSWYLSVDFHCFIIGILLIAVFYKMPRKNGYTFLGCALILSTAIPFYFTYKYDLDPIFKSIAIPRRLEYIDHFLNYYVKTSVHLVSYITGLIFGALIYDSKIANWRLSKVWSRILYIVAVIVSFSAVWSGIFFTNPNLKTTTFSKALYASLQRPIFACCICLIPLLFTIGDGLDFYYNILTAKWWQLISKISYSIYLTHFAMFLYEFGTARTSFTCSFYNAFKDFVGDTVYSLCLGLFFAILIEFPFKNIGNLLLNKTNRRKRSSNTVKKME